MSRFVQPASRVLTISGGDTLVVRERLSNGEQRAKFARMSEQGVSGDLQVRTLQTGLALVTAYLLDWSLKDEADQPVVIRDLPVEQLEQVLDQLSPEDFGEIKDAIEAHEQARRAEREKKTAGEPASKPTSLSPAVVAGDTKTSAI